MWITRKHFILKQSVTTVTAGYRIYALNETTKVSEKSVKAQSKLARSSYRLVARLSHCPLCSTAWLVDYDSHAPLMDPLFCKHGKCLSQALTIPVLIGNDDGRDDVELDGPLWKPSIPPSELE